MPERGSSSAFFVFLFFFVLLGKGMLEVARFFVQSLSSKVAQCSCRVFLDGYKDSFWMVFLLMSSVMASWKLGWCFFCLGKSCEVVKLTLR